MAAILPTGTVTFLFTDMVGSTSLWEQFPTEMPTVLVAHDVIVRAAVDDHDGIVFATGGDGFAVAFQRASGAVAAAVDIQRALGAHPWDVVVPTVRMGIHSGDANERDGDYFGPVVNRSARLMSAAIGGQILVSQVAATLAQTAEDVRLVDVGAIDLRGVAEPMRVMGVAADGVVAPSLTALPRRGNLPTPLTEFVGSIVNLEARAQEMKGSRLVTLTGPGGVGKTRLAIEAGAMVREDFDDGVWFVDLAPVGDGASVAAVVARVLGVQLQPAASVTASVVEWLRGRRLLLVIDNCEHLVSDVATLLAEVLGQCPTVRVLATSREPLGVVGETIRVVASLDADGDGSVLFCDRAERAGDAFHPTESDLLVIADICQRLDGIPLAIELAAARTRSLTLPEIRDRLDDRFRLLRGAGRSGVDRHQTLRATVQWSYQLLSDDEQLLFKRVSVFAGSFSRVAAEAVVADDALDMLDIADGLSTLVDKSMVMTEPTVTGTRYRLLETLRQFAEEKLIESGQAVAQRDRHFDHYVAHASALSDLVVTAAQVAAHTSYVDDWDNLRSAFWWALAHRGADDVQQLLIATARDAMSSTRLDHLQWISGALARAETRTTQVLGLAAIWEFIRWDFDAQAALADEGLRLDSISVAARNCHIQKGLSLTFLLEERDDAVWHLDRGAELAITAGDPFDEFWARMFRCFWAQALNPDQLESSMETVERVAQRCSAPGMLAIVATGRAQALLFLDPPDVAGALTLSEAALAAAESVEDTVGAGLARSAALQALACDGDVSRAPRVARLLREQLDTRIDGVMSNAVPPVLLYLSKLNSPEAAVTLLGHFDSVVHFPSSGMHGDFVRFEALIRGTPSYSALRASGAELSFDEVMAVALDALDSIGNVEH